MLADVSASSCAAAAKGASSWLPWCTPCPARDGVHACLPFVPLPHCLQVCEARGLVREMVFVLGRMGSAEKALRLIVEGLRDVVQVRGWSFV